ncbi:MAG: hypothetical protein CO150_02530 [Nitrospirae bacterium CG_4_9_14_3_um_filter_53_35]|nr:MAG: hypothetical protein AUK29_06250 [Nitrospirae bacterium CG2_30_53_67]PIV82737.1 MAG: hypothetical protein COW52_11985 [Nitrospirae bacterium CG17_big_fil_post_rev_8_21_14_2_50_50_9]PJA76813.1 MAG: hypothetical protein CO150_02530 [Nitrospirae bacterium CG_4_9_14_3_um_filter_53_35]
MEYKLPEKEIDSIFSRYPDKKAALLPILRVIQTKAGYISPDAEKYAAELIGVQPARVHEVVTFYSWFLEAPGGKNLILICESISCSLLGSEEILGHLKKTLGIDVGETTPDKLFTLGTVECLAHCDASPSVMINDEILAPATIEEIDRIIEGKRRNTG